MSSSHCAFVCACLSVKRHLQSRPGGHCVPTPQDTSPKEPVINACYPQQYIACYFIKLFAKREGGNTVCSCICWFLLLLHIQVLTPAVVHFGCYHHCCRADADADIGDPSGAYGYYDLKLRPPPGAEILEQQQAAAAAVISNHGDRRSFFITQRANMTDTAGNTRASVAGNGQMTLEGGNEEGMTGGGGEHPGDGESELQSLRSTAAMGR